MKRIVSVGPGKSRIEEVATPVCGEGEILIRNKYVGVCMSEHYACSHGRGSEDVLLVTGLTGEQKAHVSLIVRDFCDLNAK